MAQPRPVPLEAGLSSDNPPCPACGEPLFGWTTAPDGQPVRRCESCGLGVAGEPGAAADALQGLDRLRLPGEGPPRLRIANRAGLAASIGAAGWMLLEPGTRYLFTPEAVRRLIATRDQEVLSAGWLPGASLVAMWGTLVNGFTFGRNLAPAALGRAVRSPAPRGWQRAIDGFVSIVVALPAMLVAVPLETAAALFRRGGVLELTLRPI
jgi:hypothetical protein